MPPVTVSVSGVPSRGKEAGALTDMVLAALKCRKRLGSAMSVKVECAQRCPLSRSVSSA